MDYFTLIVMGDERSPVRRMQVPRVWLKRSAWIAGALVLVCALVTWDYWRLRADNVELASLRVKTMEQTEQLETVEDTLQTVRSELDRMQDLERKIRIIANLPGAAGVGGQEISELAPQVGSGGGERVMPPAGVPVDLTEDRTGPAEQPTEAPEVSQHTDASLELQVPGEPAPGLTTESARYIRALDQFALSLGGGVESQADSLTLLLGQLEDKRTQLASMPSIWPTKGWLTSRFGYRISPFTGQRQKHSGIDIASEPGMAIIAPARGKVKFAGRRGPLGNTVIIDHGFGVKTYYGHTSAIHVDRGDEVVRGQQIASVGSTGRSTGPHLHYGVEVKGKARDPLDYIFD